MKTGDDERIRTTTCGFTSCAQITRGWRYVSRRKAAEGRNPAVTSDCLVPKRTSPQEMARKGAVMPPRNINQLALETRRTQQRKEVAFRLQEDFLVPCTGPIGPCG
jgi:hypothetical protein